MGLLGIDTLELEVAMNLLVWLKVRSCRSYSLAATTICARLWICNTTHTHS